MNANVTTHEHGTLGEHEHPAGDREHFHDSEGFVIVEGSEVGGAGVVLPPGQSRADAPSPRDKALWPHDALPPRDPNPNVRHALDRHAGCPPGCDRSPGAPT